MKNFIKKLMPVLKPIFIIARPYIRQKFNDLWWPAIRKEAEKLPSKEEALDFVEKQARKYLDS